MKLQKVVFSEREISSRVIVSFVIELDKALTDKMSEQQALKDLPFVTTYCSDSVAVTALSKRFYLLQYFIRGRIVLSKDVLSSD